jgi:hypothetical protein
MYSAEFNMQELLHIHEAFSSLCSCRRALYISNQRCSAEAETLKHVLPGGSTFGALTRHFEEAILVPMFVVVQKHSAA